MTASHNCNTTDQLHINLPSPLQRLRNTWFDNSLPVELHIKRDDLIHPVISGNKWRKLQSVIESWPGRPQRKIVSFGGGYSNHLHALGYVCQQLEIPFTAMIRGNYETRLTPMLSDLRNWGCQIRWLSKIEYDKKQDNSWVQEQLNEPQDYLIIPEGGSAVSVHAGIAELVKELPDDLDYLLCPVGSGGTLAGMIQAMHSLGRRTEVIGIAVLKGQNYLEDLVASHVEVKAALTEHPWHIAHDYHFGGYAKAPTELKSFCAQFTHLTQIDIEPVYSGKLFFALQDLLQKGCFPEKAKVCALHTGGMQGSRTMAV